MGTKRKPELPVYSRESVDAALAVVRRNARKLKSLRSVFKITVGYKEVDGHKTPEMAIRVHVYKKRSRREVDAGHCVPAKVEQYRTDVVETRFVNQSRRRRNPLLGGIATSNFFLGLEGSLGLIAICTDTQALVAISNRHVYVAGRPNNGIGDPVLQPSSGIEEHTIGHVLNSDRTLDVAVARLTNARSVRVGEIRNGTTLVGVALPTVGMQVKRFGAVSESEGVISDIGMYEMFIGPRPGGSGPMGRGGDSGSIWFDPLRQLGIGLHFRLSQAGEGVAKNLTSIFNRLHLTMRSNG